MAPDPLQVRWARLRVPLDLSLCVGEGFFDTITLGNLVVEHQFIGVATSSTGLVDLDGILGYVAA